MLYFLGITLLTFASTFMVADTVGHVWQALSTSRVAFISYSAWMAALALTLVGTDWLTSLGFVHALFFLGCWLFTGQRDVQSSPRHGDYVRVPLTVYVPAFAVLYLLQNWLW